MKNPILQLQSKFNEWQKQILEAAEKDKEEREFLLGQVEGFKDQLKLLKERVEVLEETINHLIEQRIEEGKIMHED